MKNSNLIIIRIILLVTTFSFGIYFVFKDYGYLAFLAGIGCGQTSVYLIKLLKRKNT